MGILGGLAASILGGALDRRRGGSGAPQRPEVPYTDQPVPDYSQYRSQFQDPMTRTLFEEQMGDLGYDVSYGQPSSQIQALQEQMAGITPESQFGGFLEGRDPTLGLTQEEQAEYQRRTREHMAGMSRSDVMEMVMGRGPFGGMASRGASHGRQPTVADARGALTHIYGQQAEQQRSGLQSQITALQQQANTPTVSRREGFDPNAELNRLLTLGRGSIGDLYDEEGARAQTALRGSMARRGLLRSGMAGREQREMASDTADRRSRAQMDYGARLSEAAHRQRQQRLENIRSMLSGERGQQQAAYGGEASARRDAGQYARGQYSDQGAAYDREQAERARRSGQWSNIFSQGTGLFGDRRRPRRGGGDGFSANTSGSYGG